jgi:ribosomal protein S18 acetylase RimI-like enzyme
MTNNTVAVRKARREDLKSVQDLNYQLFVHDQVYDPLLKMNWPYDETGATYLASRVTGEAGVCFVAELDGKIVGYLCGGMMKPHSYRTIQKEAELENMLVAEEHRGQRIGEKLFEHLVAWAKEQGAEKILVSAAAQNLDAIRFYRRVGFGEYATELEFDLK